MCNLGISDLTGPSAPFTGVTSDAQTCPATIPWRRPRTPATAYKKTGLRLLASLLTAVFARPIGLRLPASLLTLRPARPIGLRLPVSLLTLRPDRRLSPGPAPAHKKSRFNGQPCSLCLPLPLLQPGLSAANLAFCKPVVVTLWAYKHSVPPPIRLSSAGYPSTITRSVGSAARAGCTFRHCLAAMKTTVVVSSAGGAGRPWWGHSGPPSGPTPGGNVRFVALFNHHYHRQK